MAETQFDPVADCDEVLLFLVEAQRVLMVFLLVGFHLMFNMNYLRIIYLHIQHQVGV
jgi:hypothetical protein